MLFLLAYIYANIGLLLELGVLIYQLNDEPSISDALERIGCMWAGTAVFVLAWPVVVYMIVEEALEKREQTRRNKA